MATQAKPSRTKIPPTKQIGGLMIKEGLISEVQLKSALKRQSKMGGHIGSILIDLDIITIEELLYFLSKQHGVAAVNLFKLKIPPEITGLLPLNKIRTLKIIPIDADERNVTLAMANDQDLLTISEVEYTLNRLVQPVLVPAFMMDYAIKSLVGDPARGVDGKECARRYAADKESVQLVPKLRKLLRYLLKADASDLLLTPGVPPSLRINNEIKRLAMAPLAVEDCERYGRELMTRERWQHFLSLKELTLAADYPEIGRFRVSLFRQNAALTILLRSLPAQPRTLDAIGMPTWIKEFTLRPEGLILVASPTGQGKSTTANALIDHINRYRRVHMVTIEDSIEVIHQPQKGNISQRQVGRDVESIAKALNHYAHLVADVILIDGLMEPEAIAGAIRAAAAGHLVIATIEAGSASAAVESLIHRFEAAAQPMMRQQLANCLLLCVSQRLIEQKAEGGLIMALEKMQSSSRVRTLIREGRLYQIRSQLQSGSDDFAPIDENLAKLYEEGRIELNVAQTWATDKKYFRELTGQAGEPSDQASSDEPH